MSVDEQTELQSIDETIGWAVRAINQSNKLLERIAAALERAHPPIAEQVSPPTDSELGRSFLEVARADSARDLEKENAQLRAIVTEVYGEGILTEDGGWET